MRIPKIFPVLAGAVLLATSAGFVSSLQGRTAELDSSNDDKLTRAYAQIHLGMPFSQIGSLGFNAKAAERLPKRVLMARFMPTDTAGFNALDPAIKNCYRAADDCAAYLFGSHTSVILVLVQNGRVTWKSKYNSVVA